MDMTVLADPGQVGTGIGHWLIPMIIAGAIVTWLTLTILASSRSRRLRPERRKDQNSHRGPNQGGFYRYSPGMYSHSYPPGKTDYDDRPS